MTSLSTIESERTYPVPASPTATGSATTTMKDYTLRNLRTIAVAGHSGSGKTLLCEAMLATSGVINRMGSIHAGTTVSDYHESERQHGLSVHTTVLECEWLGRKLNILDTPGSADFLAEGLAALPSVDCVLIVLHAGQGIQPGAEEVWEEASRLNLPKIVVINGVDRDPNGFDHTLEAARMRFGRELFPFTVPVDAGTSFHRTLDVLRSEVIAYAADASGRSVEEPATGDSALQVGRLHRELIELIAETDDNLLERFFAQGNLDEDEFRSGIHGAVQSRHVVPVFCASAERNVGLTRLLDFIAKYGSCPEDHARISARDLQGREVTLQLEDREPVGYVFKTLVEPHVGELSFIRVVSGAFKAGGEYFNSVRGNIERFGQLYLVNGRSRIPVEQVIAGDIAAVVRLRDTHTGNTLCSAARPVVLEPPAPREPILSLALRVRTRGDEERLATGLQVLHEEDPSFIHRWDSETRETVVAGQGEVHLRILAERLKRRFGVEIELMSPKIAYRETLLGETLIKHRHRKQSGGAGQFAEVWLRIGPAARTAGLVFTSTLTGQNVDRAFIPSVEKGVRRACEEGVLAGRKVTDVAVEFQDGRMHAVDSSDIAFQIAAYHAFREGFQAAKPCLLEPIAAVRLRVPEEDVGAVLGDLSARRARILGVESDGLRRVIQAQVPMRELNRYATQVRSLTAGRGSHSERFDHYDLVPLELQARILAEIRETEAR